MTRHPGVMTALVTALFVLSCQVEDVELAGDATGVETGSSGGADGADASALADQAAMPADDATLSDRTGTDGALADMTTVPPDVATPVDVTTPVSDNAVAPVDVAPVDAVVTNACLDAPARTGCRALGDTCVSGPDCCTGHCASNTCVVAGTCLGANVACTSAAQCCSSACEPVNLTATQRVCLPECLPDSMPCQRASDCCTLACNNGTCGGTECQVENDSTTSCASNAQCCTNICDPTSGRCTLDQDKNQCRHSGETCTSGGGQTCCGPCDQASNRCDPGPPGPGLCRPTSMICTTDMDCCSLVCADDGTGQARTICMSPCIATGAACQVSFECCTGGCVGNNPSVCGAVSTCAITGASCGTGTACCSGDCENGTCQVGCVAPAQ